MMPATDDALVAAQRARDLGGAEAAIAFAEDEFRRLAAAVVGEPERDHLRHRLASRATPQNALAAVGLAGRLKPEPTGSIITRSVNCSQVCGLSCSRGGGDVAAVGAEFRDPRADQAEMQIGRRRAGPAVEHERHRPLPPPACPRHRRCRTPPRRARPTGRAATACRRSRCRRSVPLSVVDFVAGDGVGRQQPQRALVDDLVELDERHGLSLAGLAVRASCATAALPAATTSSKAARRAGTVSVHGGRIHRGRS